MTRTYRIAPLAAAACLLLLTSALPVSAAIPVAVIRDAPSLADCASQVDITLDVRIPAGTGAVAIWEKPPMGTRLGAPSGGGVLKNDGSILWELSSDTLVTYQLSFLQPFNSPVAVLQGFHYLPSVGLTTKAFGDTLIQCTAPPTGGAPVGLPLGPPPTDGGAARTYQAAGPCPGAITVAIDVEPRPGSIVLAVQEMVPHDVMVQEISHDGVYFPSANLIRWAFRDPSGVEPATLTYDVVIPEGATGPHTITGAWFDDEMVSGLGHASGITGNSLRSCEDPDMPGAPLFNSFDADQNCIIGSAELFAANLAYILGQITQSERDAVAAAFEQPFYCTLP